VQRADPGKPPVLLNSTLNNQLISELALSARLQGVLTSSAGSLATVYVYRSGRRRLRWYFGFGFLGDCRASADAPA
jgi:hypothetical protein